MNDGVILQDEVWTEERVAKELGVGRARLRALRVDRLEQGRDWVLVSRAVTYTDKGMGRLREIVEAEVQAVAAVVRGKKNEVKPGWMEPPDNVWKPLTREETTVVTVFRITPNKHVLLGKLENGDLVRLRVKPSPFWCPGMRLPCVPLGIEYFEFRGRRPRAWRKW